MDGEKLFRFYRPLPPKSQGMALELRKKVLGIYDKGKAGTVVETTTDLVDKTTGEVYSSEIGSAFFVGQGGWGGPRGIQPYLQSSPTLSLTSLKGPKPHTWTLPDNRPPDGTLTIHLSTEAALLYRYGAERPPYDSSQIFY